MSESKNIQIYPSKVRIVPNDRLSKIIFNLTETDYEDALENDKEFNFREMKNHKKFGKITSHFRINAEGENFIITEPIWQFDSAVLSVCISEWHAGNRYTTPSIIYRGLTGKVGKNDAEPSKDQLAAIFDSINKLMRLQIFYNMSDVCEKLNYNNGNPKELVSTLLPCKYLKETTINGKDATIIYFDRMSPLFDIAYTKNKQIITYDATLLDVPRQQNTPMNIAVKNYVMLRIKEIKQHRMTTTITFDDLFEKCRVLNAHAEVKRRVRDSAIEFMNHLKTQSEIKDFELKKKRNFFYSIKFSYTPRKAKQYRFPKSVDNENQ